MIRRPPRATRTDTLLSLHDALPIYTSAVALAAALGADRCDIYTDVDGVYTCDPRIVAKARKLDKVTYEEMLEMASQGAKILQTRSVAMAMKHSVRVLLLSSFGDTSDRKRTRLNSRH